MMKKQYFPITTSAGGAATVYADGKAALNQPILGELCGIAYIAGTIDTGATVTLTSESGTAGTHTLWSKATIGTSNLFIHPRELAHNPADGAALTGTAGGDRVEPIIDGSLKVVVSAGGNATSGGVIVYYED